MFRKLILVVLVACGVVAVAGADEPKPAPDVTCVDLVAAKDFAGAVELCREESADMEAPVELLRAAAEAEFEGGKPELSVALWRRVVAAGAWDRDDRGSLAMALWRNKNLEEAESLLREILDRQPDLTAYKDLTSFLVDFNRSDEVIPLADAGIKRFSFACSLYEIRGTAWSSNGNQVKAAEDFTAAVAKGCPSFRWTKLGDVGNHIENPAYRPLLAPSKLVAGIDELDEHDCRDRLELLRFTMSPAVAPTVTALVLKRREAAVRFAGLGLIVQLGAEAMPSWKSMVEAGDFLLEKHCIRRMREIGDPAFMPLLESRLKADQTPSNRAVTLLTLGGMLFDTGETERGEKLMLSIDPDNNLYPVALVALADRVEGEDPARALELLELARSHEPRLFVDPGRFEKLQAVVEGTPE